MFTKAQIKDQKKAGKRITTKHNASKKPKNIEELARKAKTANRNKNTTTIKKSSGLSSKAVARKIEREYKNNFRFFPA